MRQTTTSFSSLPSVVSHKYTKTHESLNLCVYFFFPACSIVHNSYSCVTVKDFYTNDTQQTLLVTQQINALCICGRASVVAYQDTKMMYLSCSNILF